MKSDLARLLPDGSDGQDPDEIARQLGVSRQRVNQIQAAALRKCLAWCQQHGLDIRDLLPDNSDERTEWPR